MIIVIAMVVMAGFAKAAALACGTVSGSVTVAAIIAIVIVVVVAHIHRGHQLL